MLLCYDKCYEKTMCHGCELEQQRRVAMRNETVVLLHNDKRLYNRVMLLARLQEIFEPRNTMHSL